MLTKDLKKHTPFDTRGKLRETAAAAIDRFPNFFDDRLHKGIDRLMANSSDELLKTSSFEHLKKILWVQFFLQKRMEKSLEENEGQKQLFLKLFSEGPQISLASIFSTSLGIHPDQILKTFHTLLPGIQQIPGSFFLWHHPELPFLFCYSEVTKIRGKELNKKEVRAIEEELREKLALTPPLTPGLFWPYNKEDAYRQLQLLQREIKRGEDLPHVSVHFREQTSSSLEFLIYLVCPKFSESLDKIFKRLPDFLHFFCRFHYETKIPVPLQAGAFSVKMPSCSFEQCGSINLLYTRRYLLKFLEAAIGPFRDYNGGLFEMQQQHFEAIRMRLGDQIPHFDLFAEKVFYALHPVETWISLSLDEAEELFRTFSELIEEKKPFAVRTRHAGNNGFMIVKTGNNSDLVKLRRISSESSEKDWHAHLTFGDSHYLCLLGPPSEKISSILKENCFPEEKIRCFNLMLQEGIPPSLNPHYSSGDMRCRILNKLTFEGLTRLNSRGDPELAAARKAAISKEGLIYTFLLRSFSWSNGEKVTATDFVSSWQSALSDPVSHPELLFAIKNGRKFQEKKCSARDLGVRALDAETLEIELEAPDPTFLTLLAQPFFFPLFGFSREPKWFNGPYLVREESKQGILLERNPYFWDAKRAFFDQIHVKWLADCDSIYEEFLQGKTDWIGDPLSVLSPRQIKELGKAGKLRKQEASRRFQIYFNTKHPILSSPWIRKALSLSIDRSWICENLFPFSNPLSPYQANPEKALHFFETGLKKLGLTRDEFPILTFSFSLQTRRQELAYYLQSAWKKNLGIEIQLNGSEWNLFRSQIEKRNFEICGTIQGTLNEDSPGYLEKLEGSSSWNFSQWSHLEFRRIVEKTKAAKESNRDLINKAKQILEEEMPFAPLFNYTHLYAHSPLLEGYIYDPEGCIDYNGAFNKL